jgi:hypothetical protein
MEVNEFEEQSGRIRWERVGGIYRENRDRLPGGSNYPLEDSVLLLYDSIDPSDEEF